MIHVFIFKSVSTVRFCFLPLKESRLALFWLLMSSLRRESPRGKTTPSRKGIFLLACVNRFHIYLVCAKRVWKAKWRGWDVKLLPEGGIPSSSRDARCFSHVSWIQILHRNLPSTKQHNKTITSHLNNATKLLDFSHHLLTSFVGGYFII